MNMKYMPVHACDHCGQVIKANQSTIDIMMSTTKYCDTPDGKGVEVRKTMEAVPVEVMYGTDYVVVCGDCTPELAEAWESFVKSMVGIHHTND